MNDSIFIKPAAGKLVRDPITLQPLSADGERKERSPYWIRRIKDRDVELASPPRAEKAKAKPEVTT